MTCKPLITLKHFIFNGVQHSFCSGHFTLSQEEKKEYEKFCEKEGQILPIQHVKNKL